MDKIMKSVRWSLLLILSIMMLTACAPASLRTNVKERLEAYNQGQDGQQLIDEIMEEQKYLVDEGKVGPDTPTEEVIAIYYTDHTRLSEELLDLLEKEQERLSERLEELGMKKDTKQRIVTVKVDKHEDALSDYIRRHVSEEFIEQYELERPETMIVNYVTRQSLLTDTYNVTYNPTKEEAIYNAVWGERYDGLDFQYPKGRLKKEKIDQIIEVELTAEERSFLQEEAEARNMGVADLLKEKAIEKLHESPLDAFINQNNGGKSE